MRRLPSAGGVDRGRAGTSPSPGAAEVLTPAPIEQSVPVNREDPFTGKPTHRLSPTTIHKGYLVAFCCPRSGAYRGGWEKMSESEKDAFVLESLRRNGRR